MGAAAAESRDRVIDQAVEEYEAYSAGKLCWRLGANDVPGGAVEYCGDMDDPTQWAVAFVRARDNALVPLTCGDLDHVVGEFRRLDRSGVEFWSDRVCPPPMLLANGVRHHFQPARGRVLFGVVELADRTVLLVAVGTRLVAVHRANGVSTVLPLGRPGTIREVDLDYLLDYYRPRTRSKQKTQEEEALQPSPRTQAHHLRIVRGRPIDVGAGPRLTEVLSAIFEDIEARAIAPKDRPRGKPLKGKSWVPLVLRYLRKLCVLGCRDLVGLTGQIIVEIQRRFPEFKITAEAFADALKLIAATGTGLIAPREPGDRIWRIRLAALADPTSALHKRLCCETAGRPHVDKTQSNEREPPPRGPDRTPGEHAAPAHPPDGATSTTNERGGHARGHPAQASTDAPANQGDPLRVPGDAPERPRAASHPTAADPGTDDSREAAALRLVEQLGRNPLAGPLLLLWTRTPEFSASVSQLGPVAANGGVENVEAARAASGSGERLPDHAGAPEVRKVVTGDPHMDKADAVRDSIVDDHPSVGEARACEVSEGNAGDEAGAREPGAAACPVHEGGLPDAHEPPAGIEVHSSEGHPEADAPVVVRDVLVPGAALERPALRPRRRTCAPWTLVAWLVHRTARQPLNRGTLGPRGPPVRPSGLPNRSTRTAQRPAGADGRPSSRV